MQLDSIGKFIAELRKKKGLTQKELGEILSIDNRIISKWENGRYAPDITVLKELSTVLGVTVTELLEGKKNTDNEFVQDEIALKSLKYYTKQTQKRNIRVSLIIIISLIFIFAVIFGIIKYNEWHAENVQSLINEVYDFDGFIVYNKKKTIILFNNFIYKDEKIGTNMEPIINKIKISVFYKEKLIDVKNIDYEKDVLLSDALRNVSIFIDSNEIKYSSKSYLKIKVDYSDKSNNEKTSHIIKVK